MQHYIEPDDDFSVVFLTVCYDQHHTLFHHDGAIKTARCFTNIIIFLLVKMYVLNTSELKGTAWPAPVPGNLYGYWNFDHQLNRNIIDRSDVVSADIGCLFGILT